jgi:hypothetical protein
MNRDAYRNPKRKSGYSGGLEGDTLHQEGPPIRTEGRSADENRGRRAPQEGSGAVIGSGAGAGGGGADEDFDADSAGGGGAIRPASGDAKPETGADAPIGGSH